MFLISEIRCQIFRNKGRSALLVLIAALLCACMAIYVGSIQSNRNALNDLGENLPVNVTLANADGSHTGGIRITDQQYDSFCQTGVRDIRASVSGAGAMDESLREQEPFESGDVMIAGINCMEACDVPEKLFTFANGQDGSFFSREEALCAVDELFAGEHQIQPGDTLELPVYLYGGGWGYLPVDKNAKLTVAAVFGAASSAGNTVQIYVPAGWMRTTLEQNGGKAFCYDSLSATVADPLRLNAFKDSLSEMGLQPISQVPLGYDGDAFEASAVSVEDELFIKTAVKLRQNIQTYQRFLIPFFTLTIGLMALVIFLFLRNSRREMAIASSLGERKRRVALSHFCSVFLASLLGAALGFLAMCAFSGLPALTSLEICGGFLLCAAAGTGIALLLLLRFDAMELLTKTD